MEAYARQHLPDYMVPSVYVVLDQLPLTANGKVNRGALPPVEQPEHVSPDGDQARAGHATDTEVTETERELAGIWSELLGIPVEPAARPDFFALGGHSLLATRLASRIATRLGVEISLRTVFENPRLDALAQLLDERRAPVQAEEEPAEPDGGFALSGFQERVWLDERLRGTGAFYNVPLAWRVQGGIDPAGLRDALAQVVARHEVLRTRFVERDHDGSPYQIVGDPWIPDVAHRVAAGRTHESRMADARASLHAFAQRPFDIASGQPLRVMLVDLDEGGRDQLLMCCLHHLGWDIGSEPVFLRDLEQAYQDCVRRGANPGYEELPATPHQQRMAFVERFERGTVYQDAPVYHNVSSLLPLDRAPEEAELRVAVEAVLQRHPALRTTVDLSGETCTQRVQESVTASYTWLPVGREASAGQAESEERGAGDGALGELVAWLRRPFHLAEGPLFRVAIQPDGTGRCVLAVASHLAVADRASMRTVAGEIGALLVGNQLPPAPESFAQWWENRDAESAERQVARLAELADGVSDPLHLPMDRSRAAVHVYEEQAVAVGIPLDTDVAAFAAREGVSTEAVLLASFAALLMWYSGQSDFTLGVAVSRRDARSVRVVGPVDDVLPIRLRGPREQSFVSWAHACEAALKEVRACRHAPFDEVVRRVAPPNDMSRTALFDVVFVFDHDIESEYGVLDEYVPTPVAGLGKYDMCLMLRQTADSISGRLLYNGLYYDRGHMRALAGHWQRLAQEAVGRPETPVGAFEPLTQEERRRQIVEWNDTAATYPETTLTRLVSERTARSPESVALVSEAAAVTYRQLTRRAQRLAQVLIGHGVRPGGLVGLRIAPGPAQVEAVLAVLFAGAAYVPVDPAAPADRVAFTLTDSAVQLLLTDSPQTAPDAGLSGFTGRTVLLDEVDLNVPTAPGAPVPALPEPAPDDLAYVIYTSGTTGKPKGVRVTHRNVVRLVVNDRLPYRFGPDDVWVLAHSYAFDFSVWEIFGCLVHGGRLVVPDDDDLRDPRRLAELVRRRRVTVLNQTPGMFTQLVQVTSTGESAMESLRYVILGGAKFTPAALGSWLTAHPGTDVVNMYGITETTVHVTSRTITSKDVAGDRSPIGTPIPTTTVHLCDPHRIAGRHRLLPAGAVGEICVGGQGVSVGYLRRPELDSERFLPNPYGSGRLYRSGDLGRYLPDGTLEYLGRIDDQLAVRGYRIEPGEVETCLIEHPDVAQAVVTVDEADTDRLVAHLWCPGNVPAAGELRARLAEQLPEYMVPSVFHVVERVPLSVNGKVDLDELFARGVVLADTDGSAPRTETAHTLALLWEELLPVPKVFAGTSFFEAGGHSLLAATLLSKVRDCFGIDLPVRQVFENPRLQDLADRIDEARSGPSGVGTGVAEPADDHEGLLVPASDFQRRIALDEQLPGARNRYAVPLVWRVRGGRLRPELLRRALNAVVERHEALRTGFVESGGRLWQRIGAAWQPHLEEVDLAGLSPAAQEERWRELVDDAASAPFDLASGRLLKSALVNLGEHGQLLVLCLHHLVCDGPSLAPIVHDMNAAYGGAGGVGAVVQYQEFVREQEELQRSTAGREGVERWRERLTGAPAYLPWPAPAASEPSGVIEVDLPDGILERLREVSERESVSWFMTVATAFAGALHRWTGEQDVTFGCPVANRPDERHTWIVGPCTNTVVIRSTVDESTSIGQLLRATRERVLEALEDQHVSFDKVIAALNPPRTYGTTPYADAVLNLLPLDENYPLGGTILTPVTSSQLATELKFAVTVTLFREDGRDRVGLSYRGDRLAREDADTLAAIFGGLLRALADAPRRPVLARSAEGAGGGAVVQYREFVREQEELQRSTAGREGVERWRERLTGAPAYLPWPAPAASEPSGVIEVDLPDGILERLREVSERESVSWFMTVATAFAGALHRWTGEQDVTFGCPVANRPDERHTWIVGPCTNTVVIRSTVDESTSIGQLLRATRERVLEALEDQHVSFDKVIAALNPPRTYGTTPYADLALTPIVPEATSPSLGGYPMRRFPVGAEGSEWAAKGAVTASFQEEGGTLRGMLAYRGDRVGSKEVERLALLVATVLDIIVRDPDRRLSSVARITPAESAALAAWEEGPAAPPPTTIPELIAERVLATPGATAINTPEGPLSYAALDTRARRLASLIGDLICRDGEEPVVALLLDRGADLVVGMLAAWYARCAYCPVDPGYPPARISYILDDLKAQVVLTGPGHLVPSVADGATVLDVTQTPADPAAKAEGHVLPRPDDTAYVIYTSGSSGLPKGVVVRHRGLAQHARWYAETFALRPDDRVSQLINVAFDAANSEIWPTLITGAVLVPHTGPVLPGEVSRWLDHNRITVAGVPTALAEAVLEHGEAPRGLRWLVYGGAVLRSAPPTDLPYGLANCYGPTEATVTAASRVVIPSEKHLRPGRIGRPVTGVRIHVVDEAGNRCPVGTKGEILIGGGGVARGYWRRPELTAERFLPSGPDGVAGPVYRTGDLGRWLPDGTLEFVCRVDRQLKVRGHRIEPEEIEARLAAHPLVAQVAVHAVEQPTERLVAYAVRHPRTGSDQAVGAETATVLGNLREDLPAHLVPDALVWLDQLPLTPHGKVDYEALPRPARDDFLGAAPAVAPVGDREVRVAGLWREVLGIDDIGAHDNFFDLGGDSLRLAALHRRLESTFGIDLPIQRLFEYSTVRSLARAIGAAQTSEADDTSAQSAADGLRERARKGRQARQRERRTAQGQQEGTDA